MVVTENAPIGILRTVNTSRRRTPDFERIVFTPTPKRKIVPHIFKEEVKEKGLQKKGLRLLFLNVANQQLGNQTRRAERSETAEDAHWKAEGNFERMRQIKGLR